MTLNDYLGGLISMTYGGLKIKIPGGGGGEGKCDKCGEKLEPTGEKKEEGGKEFEKYKCPKCGEEKWIEIQKETKCPKCQSYRFAGTGEMKIEGGEVYEKFKCDDCGHEEWLRMKKLFCPVCGSPLVERILEMKPLDKDRVEIKIERRCTNPKCSG